MVLDATPDLPSTGVDLYWLPLGAGGHSVGWNGRIYEAASALREGRVAGELYHSALIVQLPPHSYVVEMTPVWNMPDCDRGVVAEGAVGTRWAGRWRLFRYEVHCWSDGTISDIAEAVASPTRLTSNEADSRRLLTELHAMPMPVWGRDELQTGEMWNSNSVIAWALERGGVDARAVQPPPGGRAPGWNAGIAAARANTGCESFRSPWTPKRLTSSWRNAR